MITPVNQTEQQAVEEREALERAERQASESQPGSFKDEALTDKIVHITPLEEGGAPIQGLDP